MSLLRQESLETRWHDVEDLIAVNFSSAPAERPLTQQAPVVQPVAAVQPTPALQQVPVLGQVLPHLTATNYSLPPPRRAESALLQNVTLGSAMDDVNATEFLAVLGAFDE